MSVSASQHQAIPVSLDNEGDWGEIAGRLSREGGAPTQVTEEMLTQMLGGAIPLLFAADGARRYDLLRGTFQEPVIAQCERNAGCLEGQTPVSATVHLIGVPPGEEPPTLRVHLVIQTAQTNGEEAHIGQSWELECGAETAVGQASCPNCGAPVEGGALVCGHCGHDVRSIVTVPLTVGHLEIY